MDSNRIPLLSGKSLFAMHRWFIKMDQANLLFNPEDGAANIRDSKNEQMFTPNECCQLQQDIGTMFAAHGDKVIQLALKYAYKNMSPSIKYALS